MNPIGFTAFLLLAAGLAAADPPNPKTPAQRLAALQKEHTDAEAAFRKAIEAIQDTPEGRKQYEELWRAFDKGQGERFGAAVELARAEPKSDAGFAALEWMLTIPRTYHVPAGKAAMQLAAEHHAANPKIGKIIAWIGYYGPREGTPGHPASVALIQAVAEKNPDRAARGQAVMARAWAAGRLFAVAEYKKTADADALAAEAEKAFEAVIKDYGDCCRLMREGQRTLGEEAKQELYELRHLRVGKTAPDLAAEDLDGKKFKLSDSRGKVTVVVFWASWCGPCMAQVPHERKLVARLQDRPFVLIGVNGDDDRAKAKQVTVKEKMPWRSFWNGAEGPAGPLSRAWNVRGWPTVYVLDHKGTIRAKGLHGGELDQAVDQLLKELADDKK